LRSRTNRLCEFADSNEVEATLASLMNREDGPFVARLARSPGARESRYAHLFSGSIESVSEPAAGDDAVDAGEGTPGAGLGARVARLEELVAQLREELKALKAP
jgi:uncharacterized protein YceH (UPF0502 family)